MNLTTFKAYAVTNEINLNKIAVANNIPKKYTWEEPLILHNNLLSKILNEDLGDKTSAMLFSFGSVVFINFPDKKIESFLEYLKGFVPTINLKGLSDFNDKYDLNIDTTKSDIELTDKYVVVPKFELFQIELIAIIIAKSVALERTEFELQKILDKLESMIERLESGKLRISDKELASTTAKIVKHEYNTIAYIMILDKPDVTWGNMEAGSFYDEMIEFFELSDRYEVLKKKTDILNDILNGFSSISHSVRGIFVEWIVVILIVAEVVIMILELLK